MKRSKLTAVKPLILAAGALVFAACQGPQNALDPAGIQAGRVGSLWWIFFWTCVAVYVVVMLVLLKAFFSNKRVTENSSAEIAPDAGRERRAENIVKGAVAVSVIVLFTLMVLSFRTGRAIDSLSYEDDPPVEIQLTGNQWWWNVEYQDPVPSNNIRTANELHLPVGKAVKLTLQSTDVIHSFWLPNLHGKMDLIPGYKSIFFFRPDKIGTYFGQCAEFCGYQHAKMRFAVIVESQEDFDKWEQDQRRSPPPPSDAVQQRGQQIFLTSVCTQCHSVLGTPASARVGPDLTHVATRYYIASGAMQNVHEHLKAWITDPQQIKPGVKMPMNTYSDEDLNALVSYLEALK